VCTIYSPSENLVTIGRGYFIAYVSVYKINVCLLDVFKLAIIIVVIVMGCAVFSAFSSFLYGHVVASIFCLAGCDVGFIVGAPRGWFCVGTLPVDMCAVSVVGSMVVMSVEYNINNPLPHKIM
jgi:hypothetical protein